MRAPIRFTHTITGSTGRTWVLGRYGRRGTFMVRIPAWFGRHLHMRALIRRDK